MRSPARRGPCWSGPWAHSATACRRRGGRAAPPLPPPFTPLAGGGRAREGRGLPADRTRTVAEQLRALCSGKARPGPSTAVTCGRPRLRHRRGPLADLRLDVLMRLRKKERSGARPPWRAADCHRDGFLCEHFYAGMRGLCSASRRDSGLGLPWLRPACRACRNMHPPLHAREDERSVCRSCCAGMRRHARVLVASGFHDSKTRATRSPSARACAQPPTSCAVSSACRRSAVVCGRRSSSLVSRRRLSNVVVVGRRQSWVVGLRSSAAPVSPSWVSRHRHHIAVLPAVARVRTATMSHMRAARA